MRVLDYLAGQPKRLLLAEGLALIALVAVLDYLTPWEGALAIFYLLPISLVAWSLGRWQGILVSGVSAAAWLVIDVLDGPASSHPGVLCWNSTVRLAFYLIVTLSLSSLKEALDREKKLANTDPLTGIRNARSFRESAGGEIERARRYGRPFTVAYLDLDNFKEVNDRFGHSRGDDLLRLVATTVRANLRKTDCVARLGGDEFAVLLPETSYKPATAVLRKIHGLILERMQHSGFSVTCSIGAVTFLRPAESVEALVRCADACMYAAKKQGKNRLRHILVGASPKSRPPCTTLAISTKGTGPFSTHYQADALARPLAKASGSCG